MMIPKFRNLGLGLFPQQRDPEPEEPPNVEEVDPLPAAAAAAAAGIRNSNGSGTRAIQRGDGMEFSSGNPQTTHAAAPQPVLPPQPQPQRSSRKSYALELFEAAQRKSSERESQARTTDETHNRATRKEEPPTSSAAAAATLLPAVDEDVEELRIGPGEQCIVEQDTIKLVKKRRVFLRMDQNVDAEAYLIIIPKRIMTEMPRPPDSYVTAPSSPYFFIRAVLVCISDTQSVDAAIDWLMDDQGSSQRCTIGLDCRYSGLELHMIQLCTHQRCVLIHFPSPSDLSDSSGPDRAENPDGLVRLLSTPDFLKTGTHVEKHAFVIYWATGIPVNGFKNISDAHINKQQRPHGLLSIFRKLYKWTWSGGQGVPMREFDIPKLSSQQVKFVIMNAWSSRLIALEGPGKVDGAVALLSLEDLPYQVLNLFGRAIFEALQTDESAAHETSGTLSEALSPGNLQLLQHSFRSRVRGKCTVQIHMKDDKESLYFQTHSYKGKHVELVPCPAPTINGRRQMGGGNTSDPKNSEQQQGVGERESIIDSIAGLTVLQKEQVDRKRQRLWEGLTSTIRNPSACPRHLLLVLGCELPQSGGATWESDGQDLNLHSEPFVTISSHLNDSQTEAWEDILTSPLSATIGPPGTGKTSLISAVAKSWIPARGGPENPHEVLLCTAYQNVAVRHIAETLEEAGVPGVLLLVSEDHYLGWNEVHYKDLGKSLVVSTSHHSELQANLAAWRARNLMDYPNVVVCTVDLVGYNAFVKCLMQRKVVGLIIDESSQASDVSFLHLLINLPDLSMVSVLGDPHQLPPFAALRHDPSVRSVFDLVSDRCKVNFLREQYRMPPLICDFLSAEIYDNQLTTSPQRRVGTGTPLVWSHVKGNCICAPGKTSLHNQAEAKAVVRFCETLVRSMGVADGQVVILTPYEEQTRQISSDLAAVGLDIPVHNVDSFQGQQCDIVLISLVVSRSFSQFAADQRRACVMLSRVRRLLCVFGDFDEVRRNQQAGLWMKLANHCKKQNLVVDDDKISEYVAGTVAEAKLLWGPVQERVLPPELQDNHLADTPQLPSVGVSVQVLVRARK